jgi:gluconolactonase
MYTIVEGPVWWRGALYVSEVRGEGAVPPPSRILEITADGAVSIALEDTGSNGLAIDPDDALVAARHSDGSVARIDLLGGVTFLAATFDGDRFNCPNDLAFRADGNLYFSDPSWQAPTPRPQDATRVYRVDPEGEITSFDETLDQPNGVTLSPDGDTLYVSGNQLVKYAVNADGSLGPRSDFIAGGGGDGMVVDCAGNLYVTREGGVVVYSPAGERLVRIPVSGTETTNVAFGGEDHRTLYITGMGSNGAQGLFQVELNVPGFPY